MFLLWICCRLQQCHRGTDDVVCAIGPATIDSLLFQLHHSSNENSWPHSVLSYWNLKRHLVIKCLVLTNLGIVKSSACTWRTVGQLAVRLYNIFGALTLLYRVSDLEFHFHFPLHLLPLLQWLNHTCIITFIIVFQLCSGQRPFETSRMLHITIFHTQGFFILWAGIHVPLCMQIVRQQSLSPRIVSHFCQLAAFSPHFSFFFLMPLYCQLNLNCVKQFYGKQRWTLPMILLSLFPKGWLPVPSHVFDPASPGLSVRCSLL